MNEMEGMEFIVIMNCLFAMAEHYSYIFICEKVVIKLKYRRLCSAGAMLPVAFDFVNQLKNSTHFG